MRGGRAVRWAPPVAAAFAFAAVIAAPLSLWLYLANRDQPGVNYLYGDHVAGLLYPVVGAFLLRRRPDNRVGWVFAATSIIGVNGLAGQYAVVSHLHGGWPLGTFAAWLNAWGWAPELAVPALLPLLFPDGTLASPRWRPVARIAIGALSVTFVALAFSHHPIDASDAIYNPWQLPGGAGKALLGVSSLGIMVTFACCIAGLVSLVLRTRRTHGPARAQLQWLMFSVVVTVLLGIVAMLTQGTASETIWALAMATIPAGVLIAVLRHQMLDIELVLNRTIAYALLTGVVVIAYVLTVSALGEVAAKKVGIAAVAIVALLVAAARDKVQRLVDRALFGDRKDPYAVVDRLGRSVDAANGPVDALEQMAAELCAALRLPSVAIVADSPHVGTIAAGSPVAGTVDVPIAVHGRTVGVLRVGRRHHNERLRTEEESVLHDAARRAGALLQAAVFVADLRASRERIVAAREEERRRLRHDLHDGVGPQLAGLALQLDSLGRRLGGDPDNADRVQMLRERLRDTVGEVRRVVDNLRPPALDDVGLLEAVRQQVAAYAVPPSVQVPAQVGADGHDGSSGGLAVATGPVVDVTTDGPLPPLPAAVEVAAYRIITESVANAVRHGAPSRCLVSVEASGRDLVLTITDNGRGIGSDAVPGVGLASMRERAAEVGGALDVGSDSRGTTVTARLPLELS
ncbi:MAG TPA: sensor histidine kinase [Mycobacteriales bacterium]|nr:sensor histidine kinase [Mycobacteriales bacterium]